MEDTIQAKLTGQGSEFFNLRFCDFDDVTYQVVCLPETKNVVEVSIQMSCIGQLLDSGANEMLEKEYPGMRTTSQEGFDLTLRLDTESLPFDVATTCKKFAHIKRNLLGAPLLRAFEGLVNGRVAPAAEVQFRRKEIMYVVPQEDRITVVFSVHFTEDTDAAIAKIFLLEFVEAKRQVNNAPPCSFSKEPQRELSRFPSAASADASVLGFISFTLFKEHIATPEKREKAVNLLQGFRNYLHYHIKASKSFLHSRMRARVDSMLQILNRAIPEKEKEKKTFSGRRFERR
eukprot:GILJ01000747.1.p1 GENE.GILJ01000747.1~~GILJ01000747.1.p1  ORF type:complete len:318 (+),score=44.37 GILJ01000747.1:92-955(+)